MFQVGLRVALFTPQCGQVRHSSGKLKELAIRLKAIKNIQKITKTMKMISSAKFAQASKAVVPARVYGVGALEIFDKVPMDTESKNKQVYFAISSDRGLCGALHSNIGRAVKAEYEQKPAETEVKIITVGEKSKVFLQSSGLAKALMMECKEIGRVPPSFNDSSAIAQEVLACDYTFDHGKVFYNWFKSAMSQVIKQQPMYSVDVIGASGSMSIYDSLDEEVIQSYQEFQLANTLYYTMKENYTSEQGARMVAMDGASKNAGEMIDRMTLLYNRTRQAVITTELIEIISGMTAL